METAHREMREYFKVKRTKVRKAGRRKGSRCLIFEDREERRVRESDPVTRCGGVAQLGEHLLCKQGVIGSIPTISTNEMGS